MREDEVADSISALDWEVVFVEGLDEPRVFGGDELARCRVGPELLTTSVLTRRRVIELVGDLPCTRSHRAGRCRLAALFATVGVSSC